MKSMILVLFLSLLIAAAVAEISGHVANGILEAVLEKLHDAGM
jgi:hypothetical protein